MMRARRANTPATAQRSSAGASLTFSILSSESADRSITMWVSVPLGPVKLIAAAALRVMSLARSNFAQRLGRPELFATEDFMIR